MAGGEIPLDGVNAAGTEAGGHVAPNLEDVLAVRADLAPHNEGNALPADLAPENGGVPQAMIDEAGFNIDEAGFNIDEAGFNIDEAGFNIDEAGFNIDEAGFNINEAGFNIDEALFNIDEALKGLPLRRSQVGPFFIFF